MVKQDPTGQKGGVFVIFQANTKSMIILLSQVITVARDLAIEPAKGMMSSRIRFRHCSRPY